MGEWIGRNRKARRSYGFDEIALVPGSVTINPDEVDIAWQIGRKTYPIPVLASAMDGVVDTRFAARMGKLGGIAVLNLEGIQTRYDHPEVVLKKIPGRGTIGNGGNLRDTQAQYPARGAGGPGSDSNQDCTDTRFHKFQRDIVRHAVSDHHGNRDHF